MKSRLAARLLINGLAALALVTLGAAWARQSTNPTGSITVKLPPARTTPDAGFRFS